ncbi:uncharacterized protein LOC144199117 [Stigmatopora nigra]
MWKSHRSCWTQTSTMRPVCCWLMLLPLIMAAAIRARRENVLSFLNDALDTTTKKNSPAILTDMSEDQSFERAKQDSIAEPAVSDAKLGGESEDLDSDEVPPRRQMGAVNLNERQAQDQQSQESTEVNSDEDIINGSNTPSLLSPQHSIVERKSSAEWAHSLAPSRKIVDQNNLRGISDAVLRDIDDDETQELLSSETRPIGQ